MPGSNMGMGDPMGGGMPPMGDPSSMNGGMDGGFDQMPEGDPNAMGGAPDMGMDEPMSGDAQDGQNQFDTNFDAGVQADEDSDPKTFIQQLTGKLSTSLRKYNEQLPQPDVDLDKYVAGMILKQAINGLSDKDANEILKKVKPTEPSAEGGEDKTLDDVDADSGEADGGDGMKDMGGGQMPPVNEKKLSEKKRLIKEMFQELTQGVTKTDRNSNEKNVPSTQKPLDKTKKRKTITQKAFSSK